MKTTETPTPARRRSPIFWVPTAYFGMGLPFVVLNMVAVLMYKGLGVSDAKIAFWTSLIMLPWTLKPLWSPLLEMYRTKKFFVVLTQMVSGVTFGLIALSLHLPSFFAITIALFAIVAFSGATHDVAWCNGYKGQPTIGVAWTTDFKTFHQVENAFLPFNRNGVLFPRKINGKFAMLSRPSDNGHTPFGDIYYSESPDLEFWGHHRHVMSPAPFEVSAWQCLKIGAGPIPIETSEGWLLFYHGVLRSCNGYVYAFGSALLDLDEPWKVKFRSGPYLISPREPYECMGDVPNVCFPCAALHDPATGRVAVYYGCADTVTGLAFGYIPEIIEFTKRTSII